MTAAGRMAFNDRLDAAVAGFFSSIAVIVVLAGSIHEWLQVLRGRKPAVTTEIPFQPRQPTERAA